MMIVMVLFCVFKNTDCTLIIQPGKSTRLFSCVFDKPTKIELESNLEFWSNSILKIETERKSQPYP